MYTHAWWYDRPEGRMYAGRKVGRLKCTEVEARLPGLLRLGTGGSPTHSFAYRRGLVRNTGH